MDEASNFREAYLHSARLEKILTETPWVGRPLIGFLLGLMVASAVEAQEVAELRVQRLGSKLAIRVLAHNPTAGWVGPIAIDLSMRVPILEIWVPLRRWKSEHALGPGQHLARDLFGENHLLLQTLSQASPLQLRARVAGPGLRGMAEKRLK